MKEREKICVPAWTTPADMLTERSCWRHRCQLGPASPAGLAGRLCSFPPQALEELFRALDLEKKSLAVGHTQVLEPAARGPLLPGGQRAVSPSPLPSPSAGLPEGRRPSAAGEAARESAVPEPGSAPGGLQGPPLPPEVPEVKGSPASRWRRAGSRAQGGWSGERTHRGGWAAFSRVPC